MAIMGWIWVGWLWEELFQHTTPPTPGQLISWLISVHILKFWGNTISNFRPPPVALEFSDSLARSRHRPAPQYRRQNFHPWSQTRIQTSSLTSGTSQQHQTHQEYHRPKRRRPNLVFERFIFNPRSRSVLDFHLKLEYCHCTHWWGDNCYLNQRLMSPQNHPCNQWLMHPYESDASKWPT